ncbi:MAG TPA: diguanylate cyclase, partial [Thermoanaerobaculia bacterium]|nr:diguanylate cyclase [Thermoanaerobaculia bacterium]
TTGVATSRDGRRFERVATPEWVSLNAVVCMLEDRQGALWFGTSGDGLVRRDATGFRVLTTRDGLVSDRIAALHEDDEGTLWIGSAWSGINRLKGGRITAIRPENGLAEGRAQTLIPDRFGGLWLTGNKGFQRLLKKELNEVADGLRKVVRPLSFGLADGLRSASFASGQQPAGSVGSDGRIWLPSYRGIVVVDPARIPPPPPAPGARVEEVVVDGSLRAARREVKIEPGRRLLEVRYAATTLRPPELVGFRFRLDGFDDDWHQVGTRRAAYYTALPPGRYQFRVQSRVGDGAWGQEAEPLAFVLEPAFHQTSWFRLLAALLVLGGAGLLLRSRTARLKRRHDELERLVGERTDALREANERLSELSFSDALTGIPNRRRLDEALDAEWKRAVRFGHPLSLVLADIDFFKRYNDALGHPAGDRCLVEVARVLQANARRAGDVAARFGGEEFALLLPATSGADAAAVAERTRAALEALALPHPEGAAPVVTASFGVATFVPESDGDPERLLATADAALYRAKREGRNRVVSATPRGGRPPEAGRSGEHPLPKAL